MSKLSSELQQAFGTSNPYEVLHVEQDASDKALKSAYKRLALKYHPDKAPVVGDGGKDDEADNQSIKQKWTKNFQLLSKCHEILSDKERRAAYDETGELDDESDGGSGDIRNWSEYWRLLFPPITEEQIIAFEAKYKHSDEERDDLIEAYEKYQGDMTKIMSSIPCAVHDDEPRFRELLEGLIANKTIKSYTAFTHESPKKRQARKRRAEKEAAGAEVMLKEMRAKAVASGSGTSLVEMLQHRQKTRAAQADNFLNGLAAKYGAAEEAEVEGDDDDDDEDSEEGGERKKRRTKRNNGRGAKRGRGRALDKADGESSARKKRKTK